MSEFLWFVVAACSIWFSAVGDPGTDGPRMRHLVDVPLNNGAEILAFDPGTGHLFVTGHAGVSVLSMTDPRSPIVVAEHIFSNTEAWEPTSVAVDPRGRGFAVVSWVPSPVDRVPGIVQVIDTETRRIVWQMPVGYHPDCVAFTPDGNRLLIANECEPGDTDRPGGITVVGLSQIEKPADFQGLNNAVSFGFSQEHLGEGVDLSILRSPGGDSIRGQTGIEPEYLAPTNQGVWVSLQENNALGYFDFALSQWTTILGLGSFHHAFDGSDTDGIHIAADSGIGLLVQPDTIARFKDKHGNGYLLLANEGEQGDAHRIRLEDAIGEGLIDPGAHAVLDALNAGDAVNRLGRLRISSIDGDLDGDGDIDQPMVFGGRNIAVVDPNSGEIIWDSGSQIEELVAERWPERFNAGDARSPKSGPEPEGLAIAVIDGRTYGFVGLERVGAVLMYDLTDPRDARFVDAVAIIEGSSPEGLCVFTMDGRYFLAVASEKVERVTLLEILQSE